MADEYDERMQELIEDEDGDSWTPAQLRAAAEAQVRDEQGEGSFGGLEETNAPNADVDAMVKAASGAAEPRERELNPANFGQFFKDNIFSGSLGTGYVTGKRPMTAVDYVTDVAIAHGGGNIGRRNEALIKGASSGQTSPLKAAESGQNIKTGRAREEQSKASTTKSRVETEKLTGDLIQQMMTDLDSDLWAGELKALSKEHGIALRPGVMSMTERMATKLNEAGVRHPAEVLQDPDKFDPALVNRVRHTMRLLNDQIEKSRASDVAAEEKVSALGIKKAEESTRKAEQLGVDDALFQIQDELAKLPEGSPERQQLEAQSAAVRSGGTSREDVLKKRAGVGGSEGGRNARWQSYVTRATEELGSGASPGTIQARAVDLENQDKAGAAVGIADAKALAEKERLLAEGLGQLDQMKTEMGGTGMGKAGFAGGLKSRAMAGANLVSDLPSVRTVDAVNANMTNIARSLGGQKGVLSDLDVDIISRGLGFRPGAGDTMEGWQRRVQVFESIAQAGLDEIRRAVKERREPRKIQMNESERKMFGATGGQSGAADTGNKKAEADAIRAEQDPTRRKQMADAYVQKYGGQR